MPVGERRLLEPTELRPQEQQLCAKAVEGGLVGTDAVQEQEQEQERLAVAGAVPRKLKFHCHHGCFITS
jgi:hypothetical protein